MHTSKKTIEQVVFLESDFKELNLSLGERLGQFYILKMGLSQRYVTQLSILKNQREYHVLCSYQENTTKPEEFLPDWNTDLVEKFRNGGLI